MLHFRALLGNATSYCCPPITSLLLLASSPSSTTVVLRVQFSCLIVFMPTHRFTFWQYISRFARKLFNHYSWPAGVYCCGDRSLLTRAVLLMHHCSSHCWDKQQYASCFGAGYIHIIFAAWVCGNAIAGQFFVRFHWLCIAAVSHLHWHGKKGVHI